MKNYVTYDPKAIEYYRSQHPDGAVLVSVICLVYNHEKYLRKCLDGFVMQKTDFAFEVLINDDASTDSSADILREYEAKYPNILRVIYQKENLHSQKKSVSEVLYKIAQGKYIAFCEGDDYWCDPEKLQSQVDLLKEHPDSHICAGKVACCAEDGTMLGRAYPSFPLKTQVFSGRDFLARFSTIHFVHLCSYLIDAAYIRMYYPPENTSARVVPSPFRDAICVMLYAGFGNVCYLDRVMAVHRMGSEAGWSIRFNNSSNEEKKAMKMRSISAVESIDAFFNYVYHDEYDAWCYSKIAFLADTTQDYRIFREKNNRARLKKYGSRNEKIRFGLCAAFPSFFSPVFRRYFKMKGTQVGEITTG